MTKKQNGSCPAKDSAGKQAKKGTKKRAGKQKAAQSYLEAELHHLEKALGAPARTYKDRVFRMLLKKKENSLEVYNAMNGTNYDNSGDLIITTLENAVYLGMKNDVSFILHDQLMLYEHQSTDNPNMPLRDLFYVACVFAGLTRSENLHHDQLIKIPEPKFVVFYNGVDKIPERSELRLSDAYESRSGDVALELKILVLNINPGYNQELLARSPVLHEYMVFTDTVRKYEKKLPFPKAVEAAVSECIENNILKEFLIENKAEVIKMSIFEYDEKGHMKLIRREGLEEGRRDGIKIGKDCINKLIIRLNENGRTADIIKAAADPDYQEQLLKEFHL